MGPCRLWRWACVGLCAGAAVTAEAVRGSSAPSVSGQTPIVVAATTAPDQYVFFPQTLQWVGRHLLLSYQADSDALHDDGWIGATYGSADNGSTWYPIALPTKSTPQYLVKPCVDLGPAKGALCFRYPLRAPPTGFPTAHDEAVLPGQLFTQGVAGRLVLAGTETATLRFPPAVALKEWGAHTYLMVTDGTVLPLKDGSLMMLLYGDYQNATAYSIVAVRSTDLGQSWAWLSTVSHGQPAPCQAPSEHDCVRLAAGHIYCVWRSGGTDQPLCSSTSTDEGRTWSVAVPLGGETIATNAGSATPFGVEPKIVKLDRSGKLVISTGRTGLWVWVSDDPPATWTAFNVAAHHNALVTNRSLKFSTDNPSGSETTAYTGLVAVPGTDDVIVSYDRLANGWSPAPWPQGVSAIFTVRLSIVP